MTLEDIWGDIAILIAQKFLLARKEQGVYEQ